MGLQSVGHDWSDLARIEKDMGSQKGLHSWAETAEIQTWLWPLTPLRATEHPSSAAEGFLRGSEGFPKNQGEGGGETAVLLRVFPSVKIPVL